MSEATFTESFLKPTEAFVLQHLDATELNRLPPDVLLWMLVLAGAFFAIHFALNVVLPGLGQKRKSK